MALVRADDFNRGAARCVAADDEESSVSGQLPTVFQEEERKARKPHQCCECAEIIPAGFVYRYSHGVWDGEGRDYKTCVRCAKVRDLAYRRVREADEGPFFGGLALFIGDEHDYAGDDTLAGLTTKAQIIDKAGELWATKP
jgi:hypothetical protein